MGQLSPDLVVLTYNILCPVYKRLSGSGEHAGLRRESESVPLWRRRMKQVIGEISECRPTPHIICLQEFWFNPDCIEMFRDAFGTAYTFSLARRPGKEDGLATLVRKHSTRIGSPHLVKEFSLLPKSDRVALLVAIKCMPPSEKDATAAGAPARELVVVNTHLTFPHGKLLERLRLKQARAISRIVQHYAAAECGSGCDIVVLGDFNGEPSGRVCSHMRHAGYTSCLAKVWGAKAAPVTHRNHLGDSVFVDHVFLRRYVPSPRDKALSKRPSLRFLRGAGGGRTTDQRALRHTASCQLLPSESRARRLSFLTSRRARVDNASSVDMEASAQNDDASSLSSNQSVHSGTLAEQGATNDRRRLLSDSNMMSTSMSALEDSCRILGLVPFDAHVLPATVPARTWPAQPRCSDHRPVCVRFGYAWTTSGQTRASATERDEE